MVTLGGIAEILKDFDDFTVQVSSDSQVTISPVIPLKQSLQKILSERRFKGKSKTILKELTNNLIAAAANIYDSLDDYKEYGLATFFDPRFKATLFQGISKADNLKSR